MIEFLFVRAVIGLLVALIISCIRHAIQDVIDPYGEDIPVIPHSNCEYVGQELFGWFSLLLLPEFYLLYYIVKITIDVCKFIHKKGGLWKFLITKKYDL